jgi:cytoskeletal protein RodZ
MRGSRKAIALLAAAAAVVAVSAASASAQIMVDPSTTPEENPAGLGPITPFGLHVSLALILGILGLLIVLAFIVSYMRYAPRFAKDEESLRVVRADRVVLGRELPRRNVDLSQAATVVVAPPALPAALAAASAQAATPAAVATAPAPAAEAAPAAATETAPAAATETAPADTVPPDTPASPAPAAPAAPAPPAERVEVTMDQAVYEQTLKELQDAGTDRRIAEGKARRAGMIAAKKAAGEG